MCSLFSVCSENVRVSWCWQRTYEEDDDVVGSVLCVSGSGMSDVDVGGRHQQPAGNEAEDSRLGRRAGLRPGPAITKSNDIGKNVERTCCCRV